MKISRVLTTAGTGIACCFFALSAEALPYASGDRIYVAQDGNVVATYLGTLTPSGDNIGSIYSDQLYLYSPADPIVAMFNRSSTPGATIDLGYFTAGTELVFRMDVWEISAQWYSGPDSSPGSNPFQHPHAWVTFDLGNVANLTGVYYEDLGLDTPDDSYNRAVYNDLAFSLTNTTSSTVPLPGAVWLLGGALGGLGWLRRRSR